MSATDDYELGLAVAAVGAEHAGIPNEAWRCDPQDVEFVGAALRPSLEQLVAAAARVVESLQAIVEAEGFAASAAPQQNRGKVE